MFYNSVIANCKRISYRVVSTLQRNIGNQYTYRIGRYFNRKEIYYT